MSGKTPEMAIRNQRDRELFHELSEIKALAEQIIESHDDCRRVHKARMIVTRCGRATDLLRHCRIAAT